MNAFGVRKEIHGFPLTVNCYRCSTGHSRRCVTVIVVVVGTKTIRTVSTKTMSSLEETKVKEVLVADRDLQGLRRLRELGLLLPPVLLPSTASTTTRTSTSRMIFPPEESLASFWTATTATSSTTSDLEDARVQLDEQGRVTYLNLCGKRLHRGLEARALTRRS